MPAPRLFRTIAIVIALAAMGAGIGVYSARYYRPQPPQIDGFLWPNPKVIGPFAAVDQDGHKFGLPQLLGKWSFLFFGYTHCPDVCPITLAVLAQLGRSIAPEAGGAPAQMVFVTVDPPRDTTDRLREYVRYFDARMVGVGGSPSQVQSLTAQIGIAVLPGTPDASGDYTVDHSASVFLIDPKGRLVAIFPAPHDAAAMRARFQSIRDFIERAGT